ncbi:MAG TPA: acyl-CoA reductase [Edaphocola sp.]|nr:acyl-CoA reductase [Edaphocola sp.]
MINITDKVLLMQQLGVYFEKMDEELRTVIETAHRNNAWFTPDFVEFSLKTIQENFLQKDKLEVWLNTYPQLSKAQEHPKTVGIVMAGNIPLVGFHDFLCVFLSGHRQRIKLSSKDTTLWKHIIDKMNAWNPDFSNWVQVDEMLKGCDAYIATGSNNSARYFDYYFKKYPHIIRRNRSSVAVLDGNETNKDLELLADDMNLYFGLGCRNVTQIFVPRDYNFERLIAAMDKYKEHIHHNKFKNNYDYQLAIFLLNKQFYMSNGHLLFVESDSLYAPISVVHYQYYDGEKDACIEQLLKDDNIQCINTNNKNTIKPHVLSYGQNQCPTLTDYADGVDTMEFLSKL